jgi:type II secretory pathway pseudopilin PulG
LQRHRDMKPNPCVTCKKNITDKRAPGVSCCECNQIFHIKCVGIDKKKFETESKKPDYKWTCAPCKPSARRSQIFPAPSVRLSQAPQLCASTQPSTSAQADRNQLQELSAAFNALTEAFQSYKTDTDARIALLEAQQANNNQTVTTLTATIQKVETKTEDLEQVSIADSLTIQGIPDTNLENPLEAAIEVGVQIGCELNTSEIDCKISRSGAKQLLDITFVSKSARTAFLHAGKRFNRNKKQLSVNGDQFKIFVNEKLTAEQKRLLYDTKCFARENNFLHVWFCNSVVHLKKTDNSTLLLIRSREYLDNLARNVNSTQNNLAEAGTLLPERSRNSVEDERASSIN